MPAGRRGGLVTRRRADGGASALELAILAPALLFLIFFMIQAALWLYGRNVALQAAREGVSQLRLVQATEDIGAARDRARASAERFAGVVGGNTLLDPAATTGYDENNSGQVRITVTGHTVSLMPGVTLHVTQTATGEIERFEPDLRTR